MTAAGGGDDRTPTVPEEHLDGWTLADRTQETVFRLPAATVVGHTLVYEDERLREAVADATDGALDRTWRFFFATGLSFSPPLPPGIGPAAVYSTVASEADSRFAEVLRERGFRDVERGRRERVRVASGNRARLRVYEATLDLGLPDGTDRALPVEGWLGVWTTGGEFRLAGGAYPAQSLGAVLNVSVPADATRDRFRDDLLDLVRAVE